VLRVSLVGSVVCFFLYRAVTQDNSEQQVDLSAHGERVEPKTVPNEVIEGGDGS
jgi:hypothetical protein